MRRYDLLVIDLDGTLLGAGGVVSQGNREAVRRALDAGMEIVIATGRALVECGHILDAIDHQGLLIGAGGSVLTDIATGCTIERSAMPEDVAREVSAALLGHGHKVLVLKDCDAAGYDYLAIGPGELDAASRWWFEHLPVTVRFVDEIDHDPHPCDTLRVAVVACERELLPIAMDLRAQLAGRAFLQHWPAVTATEATGSATHLLEVFNPNVNKWTMLACSLASRGIDPARVAAIGDGLNDVELLREAGLGIAMGDGDERAISVANRVTMNGHCDDGVAEAVDKILSGAW